MKNYQIIVAAFSIFVAVIGAGGGALYALGSFNALTYNPAKWTSFGRFCMMYILFVVFVVAAIASGIFISKTSEKK